MNLVVRAQEMPDKYSNYQNLVRSEREGIDFTIRVAVGNNPSILLLGPHAGEIEVGTSEIVCALARDDFSYYLFEGLKTRGSRDLHITSTHFNEPRCLALVQKSEKVIAFHGERSKAEVVYLGGLDCELLEHLRLALIENDYVVKRHTNPALQGFSPYNICNRGKSGGGVQLELSAGLRRCFFQSLTANGRKRPTEELDKFIRALRCGLRSARAL